jgi:small-conductance mechanosensitive channel
MDNQLLLRVEAFLSQEVLNNLVSEYLLALGIFLIGLFIINFILKNILLNNLKKWLIKFHFHANNRLIKILQGTLIPLLYLGLIYISIRNLTLHPILNQAIDVLGLIFATFIGIRLIGNLIEYTLRVYWLRGEEDETRQQSVQILSPALRIITWTIGIIFLLGNLGFDISALVASLGIGGIAIALAAQGVFQELFSYFSILLDRPVQIGDFIIVGDLIGSVEHIGIKTTRLRSLSGEELILSNSDLTSSRIRNYKRMEERRIVFQIGVTYETSLEKLQAIPEFIREIINNVEKTRFDRCHFSSYGDFSLNFETVYYVETPDYYDYMDAQQKINFAIKERFEAKGIEMAYPTEVLYVNSSEGKLEE